MSDSMARSIDNGSISDSMSQQTITRPKFQPIRLKALLHFCESDDDDDDDNDSERKPQESEDESDDEPQPLQQDESMEEASQQLFPSKKDINSSKIDPQKDKSLMHISQQESHKAASDVSSILDKLNCTKNKEECKISDANIENEEKTQNCNDSKTISNSHQVEALHELSTNIALPSSSLYKEDYNIISDTNRNLQSTSNGHQSHHENVYISDVLNRRKEEHVYNMLADNKKLFTFSGDKFLLNLNEDKQHKSTNSLVNVEQSNKDQEKGYNRRISNVELESISTSLSTTSGKLTHPMAKYSSQYNDAKYEGNEKYAAENKLVDFNTPSFSDISKSYPAVNRSVAETPMKHLQVGPMHPNPCTSHKQLFCTPQNKLLGDSSKSHIQTPSTILSSWCHNMRHTPMDTKSHVTKDCVQTPRNAVYVPVIGKGESSKCVMLDFVIFFLSEFLIFY